MGAIAPRQLSPDSLVVAREWKPGELTASGYAYIVKREFRQSELLEMVDRFFCFRFQLKIDFFQLAVELLNLGIRRAELGAQLSDLDS